MAASVVGRDDELASIRDFVTGISDETSTLVLEGEAGVGKTTLWRFGVETAESRGLCILAAQPAESETALSFSGLGDLLDPVLEEVMAPLPAGQRAALTRALVLGEVEGPPPDAHAAGVALLNALRGLASARRVLVAVDDVQWLDAASAAALAYAARRLKSEQVGLLLAYRSGIESLLVGELRRVPRCGDVRVGSLEPSALHQVVQEHLGVALPRPLLAEVHDASGGNPFYALEIVRMLQRSETSVEAGRPLPVPDSLHDLVHGRLLALPQASRDFLVATAAHAHPSVSIAEAASGVQRDVGLPPACEARIVEADGDRIRFTHPLLAAGVLEIADPFRRAEIHARLAELLEDVEARAWQLAASVGEPSESVAEVLESAAHHARLRGALRPAALLLDRAAELTPRAQLEVAHRRATEAAYLHFEAGDSPRAEAQLGDLISRLPPGLQRARAILALGRVRVYEAPRAAAELFLQVVAEAEGDREALALAHEGVASCFIYLTESLDVIVEHDELALTLALALADDALAADVLTSKHTAETLLGRPEVGATAQSALALQGKCADRRIVDQPLVSLAECWTWTDQTERARETLVEMLRRVEELGDESARPFLDYLLGVAECTLGNYERGLALAREGQEAAEQSGQPVFVAYNVALASLAQAHLGLTAETSATAHRALKLVPEMGNTVALHASSALGHVQLALGASANAVAELEPLLEVVRRESIVEPGATRFVTDLIEALVELGRVERAIELLEWYEGNARQLERVSALANCSRCRGLLAAQSGDLDSALQAYKEALALHAKVELPIDHGRTLLALGAAQRRLKRRREARETLEEALGIFERIGAALWAERVRAELKRISGRAASPGALTPAEERVAAIVAEGKTNKEVAAALFLSDRTVEGHLAHIFGKLGIRHRRELAGALQTQGIILSNTGDSPVSAGSSGP